jgi:hypothetical protein
MVFSLPTMVGIGANIAGRAIKNSLSNLDDKNKNLFTSWMNLPGTPINYGDTTGMAPMVKNMTTSQKNAYQAPLSQSTIPMAVQNIMNQSTPFSSKQSTSTGAGAGAGAGAKPTTSASAPAPTPKVTVTLPNGTKTTGFINPKDNKTYFDSGFTKPVTTAGAKVTKITGDKREDFTVGGTAAPTGGTGGGTGGTTGGAAVGGNVAGTGTTGGTASGTEAGATGAGGTPASAGGTAAPKETQATAFLPDGKGGFTETQAYVRDGITYYKDENGVEQRVPVNAIVDVNGKFFQRGETGGKQLSSTDITNFQAGLQAQKQITAQTDQINNFMTRLDANRNQAIIGAERQAEMARQGMQNQMFQDWLGVRQAMTNRGLTGSGIAEDANTRLALGQQQQLANLFTGLSTQINEINQNADLTKQEKEQQILDLQNSYFDLQRQIASGMNEQQIKAQQAQTQADTEFAKIYGYNPTTGEQTIEAKKFAEQVSKNLRDYNLDLAGYTGYVTFKNEKGEVVSVPTLLREKFVEEKLQFGVKLKQEEAQEKARLTAQASKAQADAYEGKVNRVRDSLKSNEDLAYKRWKAAKDNWESIPEKNRDTTDGQRALSEMNSAWSAWQNSANSVIEYNNNPLKFVEEANI